QGGMGSISQNLATSAGQIYTLSFAYSRNLFNPSITSASAEVLLNGVLFAIVTHNSGTNANLDWQIFSRNFTATGATTTLTFNNLTGGVNEGILLDAISVAPVPEPATWAMMLLGFFGIGAVVRRTRDGSHVPQVV
ncbi:MAG TPA: PEPxxWA-CTERM sorting domain-containing protein, partial [Sphingomicrobium sp.]|nr:PEPxxWA-CTERM sorting domain-containing protein [Sphingomicrobium sp.]